MSNVLAMVLVVWMVMVRLNAMVMAGLVELEGAALDHVVEIMRPFHGHCDLSFVAAHPPHKHPNVSVLFIE